MISSLSRTVRVPWELFKIAVIDTFWPSIDQFIWVFDSRIFLLNWNYILSRVGRACRAVVVETLQCSHLVQNCQSCMRKSSLIWFDQTRVGVLDTIWPLTNLLDHLTQRALSSILAVLKLEWILYLYLYFICIDICTCEYICTWLLWPKKYSFLL